MTYIGFDETVQYLRDILDKDEQGFDVSPPLVLHFDASSI